MVTFFGSLFGTFLGMISGWFYISILEDEN